MKTLAQEVKSIGSARNLYNGNEIEAICNEAVECLELLKKIASKHTFLHLNVSLSPREVELLHKIKE